ncbi:hypothetical protein D9M69_517950 [compost metagenome]
MVVTPSARTLPLLMKGMAVSTSVKVMLTWPPSRSFSAGPVPLYGMCWKSVPVTLLNSTPARCDDAPLPDEA